MAAALVSLRFCMGISAERQVQLRFSRVVCSELALVPLHYSYQRTFNKFEGTCSSIFNFFVVSKS